MDKQLINIAETTMLILVKKSWNKLCIDEIYKKTKINKKKLKIKISTKYDLLTNINRFFDYKLTKSSTNIEKTSKKDMIFEVMMNRFDILHNYRKAIINIFESIKKRPQELVFLLPSFIKSMVVIATLAKIPINGLKGRLKIKGLLVLYFSTFLVWTKDNSRTLEKTMVSLDINLDRAGKILNFINK